jgi:hypothetical protein
VCTKIAEYYAERGQWREAEKVYRLYIMPYSEHFSGDYSPITLAKYAMVELHLGNRQEAFLAYEKARQKLLEAYKEMQGNMPVFDNILETKQLEAAVRLIAMYDKRYGGTSETRKEMEQIVALMPKFAYAHYLLAKYGLPSKYMDDPSGYRKAAKPHYEAAVKYGTGALREWAHKALQQFQNEEANSKL